MTAAQRARELVTGMLTAGPRGAAELLAAAEGANVSQRSIQREAVALGVVKTRAAFRSGWTWALLKDEGASEAIETSLAQVTGKVPLSADGRAKVIADRLRKLEEHRGKRAPIYWNDPRLLRWVQVGIQDPDLREAYELAVFALEKKQSPEPVTVGFLDKFIAQAN